MSRQNYVEEDIQDETRGMLRMRRKEKTLWDWRNVENKGGTRDWRLR